VAAGKQLANIETDSFDRELFRQFVESSAELRGLIDRGGRLLPNFYYLAQDVFASFYKYNVVIHPLDDLRLSSRLGRKLVEAVIASDSYEILRGETILDGFNSILASMTILERMISWIKSEDGMGERALFREWELAEAEERLEELRGEDETYKEIEQSGALEGPVGGAFEKVRKRAERVLLDEQGKVKEIEKEQGASIERASVKIKNIAEAAMVRALERIDEATDDLTSWGTAVGIGIEGKTQGEKLDLAEILSKNEKLKKLMLLVGSLKEEMLGARRKSWSKRGAEVFEVTYGDDLGFLIPSELMLLRSRLLKKDFLKKFAEKRLLQYHLKEEKGRGPLIVCIDGSSSMAGDKELWSKALCLCFQDLARRQKRAFSAVVFSSSEGDLRVFSSNHKNRWGLADSDVLELASYFPGGGTDFEYPLEKALELLEGREFKEADVLFVTDGEAQVGDDWLKGFLEKKKRLGFKVFSVLIDLTGRETTEALNKFSDKITTVSNLRAKDARGIFLAF
jgi:uncharacterized protein with von Willebrand factor type A (vWA) domain